MISRPRVSIVRCDARSNDRQVMDAVDRSLDLLGNTMDGWRDGLECLTVLAGRLSVCSWHTTPSNR